MHGRFLFFAIISIRREGLLIKRFHGSSTSMFRREQIKVHDSLVSPLCVGVWTSINSHLFDCHRYNTEVFFRREEKERNLLERIFFSFSRWLNR